MVLVVTSSLPSREISKGKLFPLKSSPERVRGVTPLFLGGIGVMNVMLVAVRERTREIGVRKAVGATRRAILGQFFIETLIVVFLSGGAGMGIGYGLCALVNL